MSTGIESTTQCPQNTIREARKAILEAENWIGECSGGETAIALAVIAVAKTNLALEARLGEIVERLEERR